MSGKKKQDNKQRANGSKSATHHKGGTSKPAPGKKATSAPKKSNSTVTWVVAALVVAGIIGLVALTSAKGDPSAPTTSATTDPANPTGTVPDPAPANGAPTGGAAEEAKYIGRYLPEGYLEAQVSKGGGVSVDTPMAPLTAKSDANGLSIPLSEVVSSRNASFSYRKADGKSVPLVAYVKPSGKLFVGVSYCVPCKGTGQTLTSDGLLTCDSCGTKRDPETGEGISGSCKFYPLDELPALVQDGKIYVDKAALEGWTEQPLDRKVG